MPHDVKQIKEKPGVAPHMTVVIPPHLLPPNATKLEIAVIRSVLKQYARLLPINVKRNLWNPETCPIDLLPWLAWTFGVETWSDEWTESVKRARVKQAIPIARRRGTVGSIRRVLDSYGSTFVLTEWWQKSPPGPAHTFEILMTLSGQDGEAATRDYLRTVLDDVNRTKPVRSHYTVTQGVNTMGGVKLVAAVRVVVYRRIKMVAR